MSKKTDAIYKCIDNLENLKERLDIYCKGYEEKNNLEAEASLRELRDIEFNLQQEVKTLKFWFTSLYQYNGKSTSILKKTASAKNGKKGGRPPKEISLIKIKIKDIEENIIPELEHKIVMCDSNEELETLEKLLQDAKKELSGHRQKIEKWNTEKKHG